MAHPMLRSMGRMTRRTTRRAGELGPASFSQPSCSFGAPDLETLTTCAPRSNRPGTATGGLGEAQSLGKCAAQQSRIRPGPQRSNPLGSRWPRGLDRAMKHQLRGISASLHRVFDQQTVKNVKNNATKKRRRDACSTTSPACGDDLLASQALSPCRRGLCQGGQTQEHCPALGTQERQSGGEEQEDQRQRLAPLHGSAVRPIPCLLSVSGHDKRMHGNEQLYGGMRTTLGPWTFS